MAQPSGRGGPSGWAPVVLAQRILSNDERARYRPGVTVEGSTDHTRIVRRRSARRLPTVLGLQLQHRLGAGGEGEVWAAATPAGETRALKLIRPDVLADPTVFTRRCRQLARIDDPALVRVHRAAVLTTGEWAGWGAMEMDLVGGSSLAHAQLGARAFVDLAPLAVALDRLHDGTWSSGEPLVHRDVKPANLIRTSSDGIVLVDPSSLRTVGGDMTFVGTPVFVAPEVVSGRFGPPADVYSFAATLVALHSGARGDELAGLLSDPSALDVPDAVIRALSLRAEDRPDRCVELIDTDALTATVVRRPSQSAVDDLPRPQTQRTRWRLGMLTAAAIPLIVGLLLGVPGLVVGALAALAGLVALDATMRDASTIWLPLACARWLGQTLATDDHERGRVVTTVHGALVVPLLPVIAVVAGLGERMRVWGTIGQIAGVAAIVALALTWVTVLTAGRRTAVSPMHVILGPVWIMGAFAQALARVTAAMVAALSATPAPTDSHDPDDARTTPTDGDDTARAEESADE